MLNAQQTLTQVTLALQWNPLLLEQVEERRNARKLKHAMELEGWGPMIEDAAERKAELEARNENIREQIEARRGR